MQYWDKENSNKRDAYEINMDDLVERYASIYQFNYVYHMGVFADLFISW